MLALSMILAWQMSGAAMAASPNTPSCAKQWQAAHGNPPADRTAFKRYERDAKVFGRRCVFNTDIPDAPLSKADVIAAASRHIDAKTSFVTTPPSDVNIFCPNYAKMSAPLRVAFWRGLFAAIAKEESAYHNQSLMLDFPEYSIGLYQVSINNGCSIKFESQLGDADENTACAVSLMSRLATPGFSARGKARAGIIGGDDSHLKRGAAHYWSTLRTTSSARARIIAAGKATVGCA